MCRPVAAEATASIGLLAVVAVAVVAVAVVLPAVNAAATAAAAAAAAAVAAVVVVVVVVLRQSADPKSLERQSKCGVFMVSVVGLDSSLDAQEPAPSHQEWPA